MKFGYRPGEPTTEESDLNQLRPHLRDSARSSRAALIIANLYPCYAAVFQGWSVGDVVILYWAESLVVVFYTYLKMRRIPRDWLHYSEGEGRMQVNGEDRPPYYIPRFFLFFYYFFGFGHGIFVFLFFAHSLTFEWSSYAFAVLALIASHGVSFVVNYLRNQEYEQATLKVLMSAPMKRLLFLHLFILVAGIPLAAISAFQNAIAVILFVALKTAFDLRAHLKEHAKAKMGRS